MARMRDVISPYELKQRKISYQNISKDSFVITLIGSAFQAVIHSPNKKKYVIEYKYMSANGNMNPFFTDEQVNISKFEAIGQASAMLMLWNERWHLTVAREK